MSVTSPEGRQDVVMMMKEEKDQKSKMKGQVKDRVEEKN
jgi:hypothetical protein